MRSERSRDLFPSCFLHHAHNQHLGWLVDVFAGELQHGQHLAFVQSGLQGIFQQREGFVEEGEEVVWKFVAVEVEDGGGGVVEDAAELVVEGELEAAVFEAFDFVGGFHVDGVGVEG